MTIRIFRHYVPTPLVVLALIEALLFAGAVYLASVLRFGSTQFLLAGPVGEHLPVLPRALVFSAVMMSALTALGLYVWDAGRDHWSYVVRYLTAFAVGSMAIMLVFYLVPQLFFGRGVLLLTLAISLTASAVSRAIFLKTVGISVLKRRILVLGAGARAAEIERLHEAQGKSARYQVAGYVPLPGEQAAVGKNRIIGERSPLLTLTEKFDIDEIVVGVRDRRGGKLSMPDLLECKLDGIHVIDIASFFERETGHVQLDSVNTSWMVFSDGFGRNNARDISKRLFDVGVSCALLSLTLPIMVLTALAIWLESGLPIFYRQERIGECGHPFHILKFRSMRVDAESDGKAKWASANDSRVTRVGRFIRLTRIDELPQILNVLRGQMSFVGPRPERPQFVRELARQIPYYANRHTLKPGITGWAQIRYPYGASAEDSKRKLQFDLYYIKNHTFFLDLIILFQTAQIVLLNRGAR